MSSPISSAWRMWARMPLLDVPQIGICARQLVVGDVVFERPRLEQHHRPLGAQIFQRGPLAPALGHHRQAGEFHPARREAAQDVVILVAHAAISWRFRKHHGDTEGTEPIRNDRRRMAPEPVTGRESGWLWRRRLLALLLLGLGDRRTAAGWRPAASSAAPAGLAAGRLTSRSYSRTKPPICRFRSLAIDGRTGAIRPLLIASLPHIL